ncbi:putative acylesterase/phospholipase RssA [Sinorhizobium fredii]
MLNWTFTRNNQIADLSGPNGTSLTTTPPEPVPLPAKPKIAIALGGGAARGWAHIGVLRALDEEGIEVGMIAGTSIGALVGGCYLAGKLDELEAFARSLTVRRHCQPARFRDRRRRPVWRPAAHQTHAGAPRTY